MKFHVIRPHQSIGGSGWSDYDNWLLCRCYEEGLKPRHMMGIIMGRSQHSFSAQKNVLNKEGRLDSKIWEDKIAKTHERPRFEKHVRMGEWREIARTPLPLPEPKKAKPRPSASEIPFNGQTRPKDDYLVVLEVGGMTFSVKPGSVMKIRGRETKLEFKIS